MIKCWNEVPEKRPTFSALVQTIRTALRGINEYVDLTSNTPTTGDVIRNSVALVMDGNGTATSSPGTVLHNSAVDCTDTNGTATNISIAVPYDYKEIGATTNSDYKEIGATTSTSISATDLHNSASDPMDENVSNHHTS